jgi:hypothetical protein
MYFCSLNTEEPLATSEKKSKLVAILAGVLGGFTGLVILGFIIYKTTRNVNGGKRNSWFTVEPFTSQTLPNTNPPNVDADDIGTTATTTTNTDAQRALIHNRMTSTATSLVSVTNPASGSSNNGRAPPSQTTSSSSRSRSQPSYSKLPGRARRSGMRTQSPHQGSPSPENVGSNAEVDTAIAAQIDALKREVQGLREAQQEMLGIVSPPEYDADPPAVRVTL